MVQSSGPSHRIGASVIGLQLAAQSPPPKPPQHSMVASQKVSVRPHGRPVSGGAECSRHDASSTPASSPIIDDGGADVAAELLTVTTVDDGGMALVPDYDGAMLLVPAE